MCKGVEHEPLMEDAGESWKCFLRRFEDELYIPIFQSYGFSRDAALLAWIQNKTFNLLEGQEEESVDDDEPWRHK